MPEGVAASSGQVVSDGVHDDPERAPAPDPVKAPKGWTWNRSARRWAPKVRGPVLAPPEPQYGPEEGQQEYVQDCLDGEEPGEWEQRRDPDPAWGQPEGAETRKVAEKIVLSEEDKKNAKAFIALLYGPLAETLYQLDPYCFEPLDKNASGVIDAINDCVLASPKVAKMVSNGFLVPYIKLANALFPIAKNVAHHHVLKTVKVDLDRENRTMTVAKADWSQYKAA